MLWGLLWVLQVCGGLRRRLAKLPLDVSKLLLVGGQKLYVALVEAFERRLNAGLRCRRLPPLHHRWLRQDGIEIRRPQVVLLVLCQVQEACRWHLVVLSRR